jgi:hypothetical protein
VAQARALARESQRELEVLRLIADGAARLFVSEATT